jgi:uncharacterized protein
MKKLYWIFVVFAILIVVSLGFIINKKNNTLKTGSVVIDENKFNVEIADTQSEREKGLMNRTHLDKNAGMLFVFPAPDIQTFWMKNTLIPLDIIWIGDNTIVEMTTLQAESKNNTPQYTPKNPANYVLELNSGTAIKYHFKVGDKVSFNL